MVWIMGAVFSQDMPFSQLWGPMAFHAITTGLGAFLIGKVAEGRRRQAAPAKVRPLAQQTKL